MIRGEEDYFWFLIIEKENQSRKGKSFCIFIFVKQNSKT
jgi:hypothetical protein